MAARHIQPAAQVAFAALATVSREIKAVLLDVLLRHFVGPAKAVQHLNDAQEHVFLELPFPLCHGPVAAHCAGCRNAFFPHVQAGIAK